jgi:hypothetical protein
VEVGCEGGSGVGARVSEIASATNVGRYRTRSASTTRLGVVERLCASASTADRIPTWSVQVQVVLTIAKLEYERQFTKLSSQTGGVDLMPVETRADESRAAALGKRVGLEDTTARKVRRVREAGLVALDGRIDELDDYERALRSVRRHKSLAQATLELSDAGVNVHPKALDHYLRSTKDAIDDLTPLALDALDRAEAVAQYVLPRLPKTKLGRAWRRRARKHRQELARHDEPVEAAESYVLGGLTNAIHGFLQGIPASPAGFEEFLMIVGWRSTETQQVSSASELRKPLEALSYNNLRRLLNSVSAEELAGARDDAALIREWLSAYVNGARLLFGSTDPIAAYAAALPLLERASLGLLALAVLAMRGVFGHSRLAETLDRLRAELAILEAGSALLEALPEEFHQYTHDDSRLEALDPADRQRVQSAIATAGLSLPPDMQEILIQSARAA